MFDSCEWEKKKRKHKGYRLNWRILIAKPEHRSKHVYKLNEASKVTLMSIDIPQCKQFYVFIVTLAMLLISVHYIFSSRFFPFYSKGGARRGRGKGEMSRVRIDRHTNICSPTVFLCLKHSFFLPHHKWLRLVWNSNLRNFFLVNSKESYLYLLWYIKIWSVVAFLFIFQIASAYSIYQQSQSIKVYKHIEENADEISKDLPFSKKHLLGITVYFCLVPNKPVRKIMWLARTKIFSFVRLYME